MRLRATWRPRRGRASRRRVALLRLLARLTMPFFRAEADGDDREQRQAAAAEQAASLAALERGGLPLRASSAAVEMSGGAGSSPPICR